MSVTNLGRVQGGSLFYSTATSGTSIAKSTLTPTTITALVGDLVLFSNGDLRKITAVASTTIICGSVVASLKGPQGETGPQPDVYVSSVVGQTGAVTANQIIQAILTGKVLGGDKYYYKKQGTINPTGTESHYIELYGGLLIQWGRVERSSNAQAVTFPMQHYISTPRVLATHDQRGADNNCYPVCVGKVTTTNFTLNWYNNGGYGATWLAIGFTNNATSFNAEMSF